MGKNEGREPHIRHQRQQLIPGWRQDRLSTATVGVVGSGPWPASFFLAAAAALGIRRFVIVCPRLHDPFVAVARQLDPGIEIAHLEGWLTHWSTGALLDGCSVLVDFSQLGLTNKILFNTARQRSTPLVTVRCLTDITRAGFRLLSTEPGKETAAIRTMVSEPSLRAAVWDDPVTAMAAAGLALEEIKRILFEAPQTPTVVEYTRPRPRAVLETLRVAVIGAGALGNFAAPALVLSGCRHITLWDPDRVDVTNLNRQIFFAGQVGAFKAPALAHRLNTFFAAHARGLPQPFDEDTDLSPFDAVLDCVDNFETRLLISRRAQDLEKILISGGTGPDKGQVAAYDPTRGSETPARLFRMEQIVSRRAASLHPDPSGHGFSPGRAGRGALPMGDEAIAPTEQKPPEGRRGSSFSESASCLVQADPSVVMSNMIIGAFMVDALRRLLSGDPPGPLFYESSERDGLRLTVSSPSSPTDEKRRPQ
ncbi:ThiF family adenylyltransferase [Desulfosoma sp.]